jgi:hypothetical protein
MFATSIVGNKAVFASPPPIRWDLFTDSMSVRFALQNPFVAMDRTVATDGRILVSIPGFDQAVDSEGRLPDLSILNWEEFDRDTWSPASKLIKSNFTCEHSICLDCLGLCRTGLGVKQCTQCDDPLGYSVEPFCDKCNDCGYVGGPICQSCEGEGWVENTEQTILADQYHFNPGFIARIKTLGDFDWRVMPFNPRKTDSGILAFRFGDGGKGFLCGMEVHDQ